MSKWINKWLENKFQNIHIQLLWWLFWCVNLKTQGCPDSSLNIISGYVCGGVSGKDWKISGLSKEDLSSSMWEGITQSIEGLPRTKCRGRAHSPSSWDWDINFLLALDICSCFKAWSFRLNYTTSFLGSPACRWQMWDLDSIIMWNNSHNRFPLMYLYLYLYILLVCLSGES